MTALQPIAGVERLDRIAPSVSSVLSMTVHTGGSSRATIKSARAKPSASLDQRALVNIRCARL